VRGAAAVAPVALPMAGALPGAEALLEAEAFGAVASVAMPAVVPVPGAVSVATPVAVTVASSWFSCILGYLCVPMQVLWEEDAAIVPQSPAHGAHKNSAPGLLR
jgi:hypothetical protein